jgi:hypothetical protein
MFYVHSAWDTKLWVPFGAIGILMLHRLMPHRGKYREIKKPRRSIRTAGFLNGGRSKV